MAGQAKPEAAVFNGSKILIWKQITTRPWRKCWIMCCFQWFKDTNLKANHNFCSFSSEKGLAVFNGSKILIWKQITTCSFWFIFGDCCFQWFKDTNLKANHNSFRKVVLRLGAVFNGSKILIWKQITTAKLRHYRSGKLFSMVQRY